MAQKRFMILIILAAFFLMACSNKETDGTNSDQSPGATDAPTTAPTKAPTQAPTEAPSGTEVSDPQTDETKVDPVIIDDYDITASVSGTPLKEAFQDYFRIGVGLNGYNMQTDTVNSAAMSEIIKYHFNSTTYSNLMKPSYLLDQNESMKNIEAGKAEPAVKFDSAIKGLEFCKENNIQMRGHVLVWHAQTPDWFFREGYKNDGKFVDKDTMLLRLESYIKQVLEFTQTEYPGVIYAWDVVNEAIDNGAGTYETESGYNIRTKHGDNLDNLWYTVIGIDYVEKAFEYARKYADPEIKLFYNDYNTFQPMRTNSIYKLAAHLKEKGLIDGIGLQGYMDLTYPDIVGSNGSFMWAISKFAELDLELHVTELSISMKEVTEENLQKQAKRYETLFQILTNLDTASGKAANITSVTVFGIMDNYLLYDNDTNNTRLFDGKLQPKPAFYSIMGVAEQLKKK